jgi:hypothetical protein
MWGHRDGKSGFVWIAPDGTMRGWKNAGKTGLGGSDSFWKPEERNIWVPGDYDKKIHDRRNIHLADWNGDGTCDIILVDPIHSGSSFMWSAPSAAFDGSVAGTCQNFPDMDGNSRADLHSVLGTADLKADTWLSNDCGLKDRSGDSVGLSGVVDPKLPTPPEDCCR